VGRKKVWTEEYKADFGSLDVTLSDIIREGNARRIIVKNAKGRTVLKVPATLGAVALLKNPQLLVAGMWMASRGPLTIIVEKMEEDSSQNSE
jgi:hypothetical protein